MGEISSACTLVKLSHQKNIRHAPSLLRAVARGLGNCGGEDIRAHRISKSGPFSLFSPEP